MQEAFLAVAAQCTPLRGNAEGLAPRVSRAQVRVTLQRLPYAAPPAKQSVRTMIADMQVFPRNLGTRPTLQREKTRPQSAGLGPRPANNTEINFAQASSDGHHAKAGIAMHNFCMRGFA